MDKRVFTTVLLCMGILFVWQTFVAPPPKRKPKVASEVAQPSPSGPTNRTLEVAQVAADPANPGNPAAPSSQAAVVPESRTAFKTPLFAAEMTSRGGALSRLSLTEYREQDPTKPKEKHPVELIKGPPSVSLMLDNQVLDFGPWEDADSGRKTQAQIAGFKVNLAWRFSKDGYTHGLVGTIENTTTEAKVTTLGLAIHGSYDEKVLKDRSFYDPPPDLATPLAQVGGSMSRHTKEKKDSPEAGQVDWFGIDRQYFLLAAAPKQPSAKAVQFVEASVGSLTQVTSTLIHEPQTISPGSRLTFEYDVFAGPKAMQAMAASKRGFENALDYSLLGLPLGFLARPMQWVLNQAYGYTGSWGLAIILLTLVVKLLMFPVTQKSYESMQEMRELKPELDKIKQRFPNDREKQGIETMRLYRERKVSPFLSGCLPALLQFPVWVALWRMLSAAVELYQRDFLWLPDLTAKDPYYVLPAILGGLMFLQQKISPPMAEPEQQKIMMFMPVIMVVFMVGFPSGLVFYSVINTILTIAQQLYISRKFAGKTPAVAT